MRPRFPVSHRYLLVIGLVILTACAQPASTGIPTPDTTAMAAQGATATAQAQLSAQATAAASAAAIAAAAAAATAAAPPPQPQPEPTLEPVPLPSATETPVPRELVPTPKPTRRPAAPTVTKPRTSNTCNQRIVHIVQPGQNLFRIALRYRTTISAIARLNRITNTRLIRAGQRLLVITCLRGDASPKPVADGAAYTVRQGDTLMRIAARYGASVERLMLANGLLAPVVIAGQMLIIA